MEFLSDLMGLWRKRLSTVLDQLSVPHVQALFLGATWGRRVNTSIWTKVCTLRGIHEPERLLHFVQEKNLIRIDAEFWEFEEPLMRQACLERARELGELPGYHRSISEAVVDSNEVDDARTARHDFGGGLHEVACPKLLDLMEVYLATPKWVWRMRSWSRSRSV